MPVQQDLILGEYRRTLDDRFRVSIPQELLETLMAGQTDGILAKERPGCVSLWNAAAWQSTLDQGIELVKGKMRAGKLERRTEEVQLLGRLLSTRHRAVQLAPRGRLLIPEGFREFLATEAGSDVLLIGAGVCLEIWNPARWVDYLQAEMPQFRQLFDKLSG